MTNTPNLLSSTATAGRLVILQYLRATAAVGVIFYHQFQGKLYGLGDLGVHGVDLFFIISGFLMCLLSFDRAGIVKPLTPKRFALDRVARIVPTYWIATFGFFLMFTLVNRPAYHQNAEPLHLLFSLFFIPHADGYGSYLPTLFLGWTLNYEVFFYLVFGTLLSVNVIFRSLILIALFSALVIVGVLFPVSGPLSIYTDPIIIEFVAGYLIAIAFRKFARSNEIMRFVLSVICISSLMLLMGWWAPLLSYGGLACLVLGIGLAIETRFTIPNVRWILFLGTASYSLYLFQEFGFRLVLLADRLSGSYLGTMQDYFIDRIVRFAGGISAGIAGYLIIERPITAATRRFLSKVTGESSQMASAIQIRSDSDAGGH